MKTYAVVFLSILFAMVTVHVVYAEPLYPDGDATPQQWAIFPNSGAHYEKVDDDYLLNQWDNDYIYTITDTGVYGNEFFSLQDVPSSFAGLYNVVKVTVNVVAEGVEGTSFGVDILIRTYGTTHGSGNIPITETWDRYSEAYMKNPHTASQWTWDEVNDLEIGVTSLYMTKVSAIYVFVDVAPKPVIPEVPLGPVAALASMFAAVALLSIRRRAR